MTATKQRIDLIPKQIKQSAINVLARALLDDIAAAKDINKNTEKSENNNGKELIA